MEIEIVFFIVNLRLDENFPVIISKSLPDVLF